MMQSLQMAIMQKLIKMLSPTSPAYNNTLAFQLPPTPSDIQQILQPGDIVFSRTNSSLYQIGRNYMGMNYDHVAVVINKQEVIHISPPIIGRLDIGYIVDPKRQPMIIRPKIEDKDRFLLLINNYLGEKYNLSAVRQIGLRELKSKLKTQEKIKFSLANLKHSRICSDSVLYALIKSSPAMEASLKEELSKTRFQHLGFFLPDEVAQILLANDAQILLKSKFQAEYKIVDFFSQGGQKLVHIAQKMVKIGNLGSNKLKKTISQFKSKSQEQKDEKSSRRFNVVQFSSLLMALAHTLGVVTLNNKTRFIMLMLNILFILGHFQQMKSYLRRNLSSL